MIKQSTRKTLGYRMTKCLHKGFKIVEYYSSDGVVRKRTIHKGLLLTEAENLLYGYEKSLEVNKQR